MAKKRVTVYIGRFQLPHNGHFYNIREAQKKSDLVIVLVGSAFQARTIKNPFTFAERERMLQTWWFTAHGYSGEYQIDIRPLPDQPYNNAKWAQSVQELVQSSIHKRGWAADDVEIYLTGADRDESTWYLNSFPQFKLDLVKPQPWGQDLSATNLRDLMFSNEYTEFHSSDVPDLINKFVAEFTKSEDWLKLKVEYDFLESYKKRFATSPYPPIFVTVDCVVIQSGHILVVERANLPGRGLWALPGGHVKPRQRLLDAAITELMEETGIKIPQQVLRASVTAKESFDDPDRSLRGRTFTTAFLIRLDDTKPLPKVRGMNMPLEETGGKIIVETKRAWWMPISEARANPDKWFEDHASIVDWGVGAIKD